MVCERFYTGCYCNEALEHKRWTTNGVPWWGTRKALMQRFVEPVMVCM